MKRVYCFNTLIQCSYQLRDTPCIWRRNRILISPPLPTSFLREMLPSVGQRNRWENDLELGDVKFIQRHSRSTLEVAFLIDKLCLKVFSGYANADACKFLDKFHLYCVFHDMNSSDPRKIAVFHLHVQGPALVLFGQLLEEKRVKWRSVQSELRNT